MCSKDENMQLCKSNHFSTIGHDDQDVTSANFTIFELIKILKVKLIKEVPYNSNIVYYYMLLYDICPRKMKIWKYSNLFILILSWMTNHMKQERTSPLSYLLRYNVWKL